MTSAFAIDFPGFISSAVFQEQSFQHISSDLYSKTTRKAYGIPTCMCSKGPFILVGTSDGFVLVFDTSSQERKVIIKTTNEKEDINSLFSNKVLTIDMVPLHDDYDYDDDGNNNDQDDNHHSDRNKNNSNSSYSVVLGLSSGEVQLWSLSGPTSARLIHMVKHRNKSPIVYVEFVQKNRRMFCSINAKVRIS